MKKAKYLLLKNMNEDVKNIFKNYKVVIAGGAITSVFTSVPINDYDVYIKSLNDLNVIISKLEEIGYEIVFDTDNAISMKMNKETKIQLIKKLIGKSADEIVNEFDFTVCMGAYDFETDKFILHDRFLYDLARKELIFNTNAKYPICSMYRTRKYQKRGFTLPGVEIIKIALAINNLNLESYADLKEQLQGIDTLFLKDVTDVLMTDDYKNKQYDMNEFLDLVSNHLDKVEEEIW